MKNSESSVAGGSGLFARLAKTRRSLSGLFSSDDAHKNVASLDELHDRLLLADVGVEASDKIIAGVRRQSGGDVMQALRAALTEILLPCENSLVTNSASPFVILMVGVNGTGKTTTLAKLAARLRAGNDNANGDERKIMLAACDTFRAAAIEQLQAWGARLGVPVIAQAHGADAAAVAYDAYTAARARGVDVLLIDTAGRQHTHDDLMAQLAKIKRVLSKVDGAAPHEILLTLDAGNGYNALSQAAHFQQTVGVDGLCITKLDGTAKGGVVVALAERFGLPIRFIGVGQEADDLREFNAEEFVAALLPDASAS